MQIYNVGYPCKRIAMDIAGPFPETDSGNKYILLIGDYFSKWIESIPFCNQEAVTVADALADTWITCFGVPLELHSDQGQNFESKVFGQVARLLGLKKTSTTPLHPQSNGMVKKFNFTVDKFLVKMVEFGTSGSRYFSWCTDC